MTHLSKKFGMNFQKFGVDFEKFGLNFEKFGVIFKKGGSGGRGGQIYMVTFCNWIANYLGWGIIFFLTKDEHCYITGVQKQKTGGDMADKIKNGKKMYEVIATTRTGIYSVLVEGDTPEYAMGYASPELNEMARGERFTSLRAEIWD